MSLVSEISRGFESMVSTATFGMMRFPGGYAIAEIPIDTFLKVDHTSKATPTKYPVETGANYSDHIVIEPMEVKISGLVSDVSADPYEYGVSSLLDGVSGFMGAGAMGAGAMAGKTSSIWDQLRAVQTSRVLFSVNTGLVFYENLCITSLQVMQDRNTSGSLRFVAQCQEILSIDFEQRQDNLATEVPEGSKAQTDIAKTNKDTNARTTPTKKKGEYKPEKPKQQSALYNTFLG
jgi:hypothetical protein